MGEQKNKGINAVEPRLMRRVSSMLVIRDENLMLEDEDLPNPHYMQYAYFIELHDGYRSHGLYHKDFDVCLAKLIEDLEEWDSTSEEEKQKYFEDEQELNREVQHMMQAYEDNLKKKL